ncbi:MAG: TraR/DksA family transcriptional regulator [Acidimicrobiales bacterium]
MSSDVSGETSVDYRALLAAERADLRAQLAELGFGEEGGLKYDSNFADTSQVTAERGEAEVLAGKLRDALTQVEAAIDRLEHGTYGACERCGEPIAPARLEAKPAARRCIACVNQQ